MCNKRHLRSRKFVCMCGKWCLQCGTNVGKMHPAKQEVCVSSVASSICTCNWTLLSPPHPTPKNVHNYGRFSPRYHLYDVQAGNKVEMAQLLRSHRNIPKDPILLQAGCQWLARMWALPTAGLGTQRLCWVTFSALHCAHKTKGLRSWEASRLYLFDSVQCELNQHAPLSLPLFFLAKTYRQNELNLFDCQSLAGSCSLEPRSFSTAPDLQASFGVPFFWPPPPAADTTGFLLTCSGMRILQNNFGVVGCCCGAPISTVFVSEEAQRFRNGRPSNCYGRQSDTISKGCTHQIKSPSRLQLKKDLVNVSNTEMSW